MLAKENRLKKEKDFERVFKSGRGYKKGFLYIKLVPNGLKSNRYGIAVGKNLSKKAVDRNKIKRRLRRIISQTPLVQGFDVVLVVLPGSGADCICLEQDALALFKKARLNEKNSD